MIQLFSSCFALHIRQEQVERDLRKAEACASTPGLVAQTGFKPQKQGSCCQLAVSIEYKLYPRGCHCRIFIMMSLLRTNTRNRDPAL